MRVTQPGFEELAHRRDQLLRQLGMDRDQLEDRARREMLTSEEFWVCREIRSLEFLMDDSAQGQEDVGESG